MSTTQLSNDNTPRPPPQPEPGPVAEAGPYVQSQSQASTVESYPKPEAEYEEIAKNPQLFLDKLQSFHLSYGAKFKVPTVGGNALDLYCLFMEVTYRGGIEKEKVVRDKERYRTEILAYRSCNHSQAQ